nr:putative wall-associated receptor kinase-like 16 [Aegilops tauschii subsp. strangulata]
MSSCSSLCPNDYEGLSSDSDERLSRPDRSMSCSGIGCCQAPIVVYREVLAGSNEIVPITSYDVELESFGWNRSEAQLWPPRVFIAEEGWLATWSLSHQLSTRGVSMEVPIWLGWEVIDDHQDDTDQLQRSSSPASASECSRDAANSVCKSSNADCRKHQRGGYTCSCKSGYEGNPYITNGCQDIDECKDLEFYKCYGQCTNMDGLFQCQCPHGTHGDHSTPGGCFSLLGGSMSTGAAAGAGLVLLFLIGFFIAKKLKQRRAQMLKCKFFHQNRGQLLQQLVPQSAGIAERMIITLEELEKATHHFDKDLVVGGGGHGIVYKGILSNQHIVAVKKPKKVLKNEINEFINEVAILSQINHRNVVKLYGCCLETEVPMLVYEFISNGTLYEHLHVQGPKSLSWDDRLRIAIEAPKSLAYLHSAASTPIIHRDIKSANILLDDTLTAKVADFGASRYIPMDISGVTTRAQGTRGYWDPMNFYTGRITEKSDVYSFGVILVELLTREKPFSYLSSDEESLVSHFASLFEKGQLLHILDPQVMEEGGNEVEEVASIAVACVKLRREDRPTMRQVELTLEGTHTLPRQTSDNASPSTKVESNTKGSTRHYSMELEFRLSAEHPR